MSAKSFEWAVASELLGDRGLFVSREAAASFAFAGETVIRLASPVPVSAMPAETLRGPNGRTPTGPEDVIGAW